MENEFVGSFLGFKNVYLFTSFVVVLFVMIFDTVISIVLQVFLY